ncbi:MAG TPA: fibronectin type III-like domain-contianing protein, partial [Myxococcota bacterium]|nr:fibronectin type III-like domain-contianing protein [Myxococcota bacterium]
AEEHVGVRVAAALAIWFGGQEAGNALADVLFGDADPGGRLPTTVPRRLEDTPAFLSYPGEHGKVYYSEGVFGGHRAYDARGVDPLFPFGFGLSYTRFALGEATVRVEESAGEAGEVRVHVALDVTNAGKRAGQEVVQLYVADPASSVARPPCELRAFAKVSLAPGERKRIEWTLGSEAFAFWDPIGRTWTAEAGDYELRIGRSSRDLPVRARLALAHDHKRGPDRPLEG